MTTFAKATFSATSYATFRPSYPRILYDTILNYHHGPRNLVLDLGCGHGVVSRSLAPHFTKVLATDPSSTMITQAKSSSSSTEFPNIRFETAAAENLDLEFLKDGEVDMVVAGQAAHWFDFEKVWKQLGKKVRVGGTLAFWGYKDNILVEYPQTDKVLDEYCYGESKDTMGPYWEQPGRERLRRLYRDVLPPGEEWGDVKRLEYEPRGEGEALMRRKMKLGELTEYWRTFSAYHEWSRDHPNRQRRDEGGVGDVLDEMIDKVLEVVPEFKGKGDAWKDVEVESEWGTVVLMARRLG